MSNLCVNWSRKGSWRYKIDDFSGLDPVQGLAIDCYFIAALKPLAWTCPSRLKNPNSAGSISARFYTDPNKPLSFATVTATVNDNLPVDDPATCNLQCAKSNTQDEIWPGIYEKMFASYLGIPCCGGVAGQPDICNQMPDGNPLFTLFNLTGWQQVPILTSAFSDGNAIFTEVNKLVAGNKVKYPTVAWTKHGFQVSGSAVVPDHSYSVLGTYSLPGANYIVLRNPCGTITRCPDIAMIDTGSWTYTDTMYVQGAIPGSLPPGMGTWPTLTRPFDLSIGLFALEANEFRNYFEGYGYVT